MKKWEGLSMRERAAIIKAGVANGIIGGTNIIRSTPWFGRYRNAIDTTLDAMGYTSAGYDVWNYLFGE